MKLKLIGVILVIMLSLAMLVTAVGAIQEAASKPPQPSDEAITVSLPAGENVAEEDKALWKYVCPFH